jgi:hypothetical protein
MNGDEQRELDAFAQISQVESLIEVTQALDSLWQTAVVQAWEARCTLEQHVDLVAITLIDSVQMQQIDRHHRLTIQTEQQLADYARALRYRLAGDRALFKQLVGDAVEREQARQAKAPAATRRAAHDVLPKTWRFTYRGQEYLFVPQMSEELGFCGEYVVMHAGEKVGHLHYFSETERWQVPSHSQTKDIRKAFVDFLHWRQNPLGGSNMAEQARAIHTVSGSWRCMDEEAWQPISASSSGVSDALTSRKKPCACRALVFDTGRSLQRLRMLGISMARANSPSGARSAGSGIPLPSTPRTSRGG